MKVTAIAGGVGGAKLIAGLATCLSPEDLTIIVNTGDDFDFLNLRICPDVDTICYTLAGISNPDTGWGWKDDSHNALKCIKSLGGPDWFTLGDKDLGTHIERTRRIHNGESLSHIIHHFCQSWGIKFNILPMSDDIVSTMISTMSDGDLSFQEYFVKNNCIPIIKKIWFKGIDTAKAAPGVLNNIDRSDLIILCPSNPFVSIDPILAIQGILPRIRQKPTIAVSPLIQGKAVKGPAAKMFFELGIEPSVIAVAQHYKNTVKALVIDNSDNDFGVDISKMDIIPFITNTLMVTLEDRIILAQNVLDFSNRIIQ